MNRIATRPVPAHALVRTQTIHPRATVRLATPEETQASRLWAVLGLGSEPGPLEVIDYASGCGVHAGETVAAGRAMLAGRPDATLLYVHRGVQAQCRTPILQTLLHRLGHAGPSFSLRREAEDALPVDPLAFAASVSGGGDALVIDDEQRRVGRAGTIAPAPVHLTLILGGFA